MLSEKKSIKRDRQHRLLSKLLSRVEGKERSTQRKESKMCFHIQLCGLLPVEKMCILNIRCFLILYFLWSNVQKITEMFDVFRAMYLGVAGRSNTQCCQVVNNIV